MDTCAVVRDFVAIGSETMRRPLLRVLSSLRWPSAVLTVLVLGLALVSSVRWPSCFASYRIAGVRLGFEAGSVRVIVSSWERALPASLRWHWEDEIAGWPPLFYGWWNWANECHPHVGGGSTRFVYFPAWCIFAPLGLLAALGFRARSRLVIPSGACPHCRHPLAGAATCPECGIAAPYSSGSGAQPS